MVFTLSNGQLTIQVNSKGAELSSVKGANGIEYLWQADSRFWGRHAPVLFPIVGRLKNDQYEYNGQKYSLGQHGFARDMEFKLHEQTDDSITMALTADSETKTMFPFDFTLLVKYTLDQQTVRVNLTVINNDQREMFFSVGAHPAFNIPLSSTHAFDDYQISVDPAKQFDRIPLENSLSAAKDEKLIDFSSPVPIERDLFKDDAVILALNEQPVKVTFEAKRHEFEHGVTLTTNNAKYVGLWSQYDKDAPFVCIEPWWGIADDVNADGQLQHKKAIDKLAAGEHYNAQYDITVY
ncbi:aldose 1-epimerase family protein [Nicoliella lavandulae]|uniref:Aldose 1-epimerase family protein n=1 Tax=Nicoliella lavandulae TaxID=3082954 RepID=A0ABU8SM45_9LACO